MFFLFTLLPIVEIVLLIWLATKTSGLFVLALVVGTGVLGALLARYQGWQTMRRISQELDQGRMPAESLVDGLLILLAAFLLIVPGLLTDVLAILLLFPPSRRVLKSLVRSRLKTRMVTIHSTSGQARYDHDEIIDVKVVETPPRQLPG